MVPGTTEEEGFDEVEARAALTRTIMLYGQLLDDQRFDDFGELFDENAVWAGAGVSFESRERIVAGLRDMQPAELGEVKHLAFTPVIDFEGDDRARAWTDLMAMGRSTEGWRIASVGRYYDTFVRRGDRWLFTSRMTGDRPDEERFRDVVPSPSS